jgi:hypothetical protein
MMISKKVFISADHGLAVVYFLQTEVVPTLLKAGVEVVLLTDDGLKDQIAHKLGQPGLTVEGLRLAKARQYFEQHDHNIQYWLHFLRWMGGSNRMNLEAPNGHWRQMQVEASRRAKLILPLIGAAKGILRRSSMARNWLVQAQMRYNPALYADLFEKYNPDLVIASTPGWRFDRYLLREAGQRKVRSAAVIVGWDNTSSYCIPGARVNDITCWSGIQQAELETGSDWPAERVNIGGIPSYDGYFKRTWLMGRDVYYHLHGLNPTRKLLSYACSFVTFSPNYPNLEALARLVSTEGALEQPCQLLIRLHPNHFQKGSLYEGEANRIRDLVKSTPHVHLVEPVPLGGELGYYSGEDMPEKASMMAYSDIFLTVYSTMVVETAIHDCPIVATCIDAPGGWNTLGKFSLSLGEIGQWPTHQRFRKAGAGRVANDEKQLRQAINLYLGAPHLDRDQRRKFILEECTFTDGEAGRRTGEWILRLLEKRI